MIGLNDLLNIFRNLPGNYIILLPDTPRYTIAAFNEARASETFTRPEHIGKGIFEVFPDNPDDPNANGVAMLTASLQIVLSEKRPHTMAVQKYDIYNESTARYEERYWKPKNVPVIDSDGNITHIIHSVEDVTAQIHAETNAIHTRQNFEDLLNQANIPFAVLTGREFRFTYANPAYIELMNNRQLVGKALPEAIPELKEQPFMQLMEKVYDTGVPYHGIEVPAMAQYGGSMEPTTRFFNLSYTPYRAVNGVAKGILAYAYDVTEQVALRKRDGVNKLNQHAYDLFMQAPVGICILKGPEHNILLANKPVQEIWGKDASIVGKPILKALPEIEGQGFVELLDSVKNTAQPYYAYEHRASLVRNGKKETVYLNFVYQPYYEADGTIDGVMAVAIEVTEQVLARKKIEYAEEAARLAIESGDLGAYEINLLTDEITTTPRFNAIWGVQQGVPRTAFAAAILDEDKPLRLEAHKKSVETGRLYYEARVAWPDGTLHWIRVNGKVLYDVENTPVRLIGIIQDVTKQRAFTEEMNRLVDERTKELQRANTRLENTNMELEQFAYIASHDLQEPLRKIQVFNGILKEKADLTAENLVYSEKIASAAKRMGGLINDLLDYSRISDTSEHFREVDLNKVLLMVLTDFDLLIAQKGATIHTNTLETITAIPLQMNQLFFNLVGNALKFSKADVPPVITIKGSRLTKEKKAREYPQLSQARDYYQITVSDNGIGFEQEYADRIFMVFQRLSQPDDHAGYGIGLALCRKVITNHGGLISARATVDVGATFTIILPYTQEEQVVAS